MTMYNNNTSYRGVPYNTTELHNRPLTPKKVMATYRGVEHTETIKVVEGAK